MFAPFFLGRSFSLVRTKYAKSASRYMKQSTIVSCREPLRRNSCARVLSILRSMAAGEDGRGRSRRRSRRRAEAMAGVGTRWKILPKQWRYFSASSCPYACTHHSGTVQWAEKRKCGSAGLFLKKYGKFLSPFSSNLLSAFIFASFHVQVTYSSSLPIFLIVTLILGLLLGYLAQKSGSILASVIFHAGTDIPIFLVYLSYLSQ